MTQPPILTFAENDTIVLMRLDPERDWEAGPLLEILAASGITCGFDERMFFRALEQPDGNLHIIAAGCPPEDGADARIVLEFRDPEQPRGRPRERADGRADLRELGSVDTVQAGQVLARRTPAGSGSPGRNVFGQVLPATPGKPATLLAGRNTMLSEDGECLWALIDGEPYVEGGRISVRPVLVIRGDVDYSTGHVAFDGSVRVLGDVLPGFAIRAGANVEVGGVVEGATIEAGGRAIVQGGVRGGAAIRAHGDVAVAYVDSGSSVETASDLRIRGSASGSTLVAALAIHVGGKLVGGSAQAGEAIYAAEIGSPAGAVTHLGIRRDFGARAIERLVAEASTHAAHPRTEAGVRRLQEIAAELGWRRERNRTSQAATYLYVQKQVHDGVRFEVDGTWCPTERAMALAGVR